MKSHNKDSKILAVSMIQIVWGGKASNQAPIKERSYAA